MAGENEGTLNDGYMSTVEDPSDSTHADEDFELTGRSTVEDDLGPGEQPSEERLNPDQQDKTEPDKKEADAKGDTEEVPVEFHKHPAWQRIMKERDEAKERAAKAEGHVDALTKLYLEAREAPKETPPAKEEPLPFKDTSKMTDEELAEWEVEDPKGYRDNLRKEATYLAKSELKKEFAAEDQQKRLTSRLEKAAGDFAKAHGDFEEMWKSGKIREFMQGNPGHNAFSAYHEIKAGESVSKADHEKAVKDAVAAKEKEMLENFKAKREASTFGKGPSIRPQTDEEELKDTNKQGGLVASIAARLERRRAGAS